MLSTLGVVVSAVVVAAGLVEFLAWPVESALIFGVLIAATDPIAVLAMFKGTGIKGRLRLLVETESLFNDGVAAVLFALVLTWAQATSTELTTATMAAALVLMTGGGNGNCVQRRSHRAGGTDIRPFGGSHTDFCRRLRIISARRELPLFGCAGDCRGRPSGGKSGRTQEGEERNRFSSDGRSFVVSLWEFAAFIANSLIFLLIGLAVAAMPLSGISTRSIVVAIGLVLVGRALAVYPLCLVFRLSAWAVPIRE